MGTLAMLLRALGAKKIIGVCIAVAYRDEYRPFLKTDRFKPKRMQIY